MTIEVPICEIVLAAGEGIEPSVSAFKAQRVAGYTIPQEASPKSQVQSPKSVSRSWLWTFDIGLWTTIGRGGRNRTYVARLSIEGSATELHREMRPTSQVQRPKSVSVR